MAKQPAPLHSMNGLSKLLGVDRKELKGIVTTLGLRTYAGTRRELFVDDDGLARLRKHLGKREPSVA